MPRTHEQAYIFLFSSKTYRLVRSWVKRLKVPYHDRKDVVQDVFAAALRTFENYNPEQGRPERWLNRITVYTASHYWERIKRRREIISRDCCASEYFAPLVKDYSPSAEEQLHQERIRINLKRNLDELHPDEKDILVQHDLEEIPMLNIARLKGIPLSTMYKWRNRGLLSLRNAWEASSI